MEEYKSDKTRPYKTKPYRDRSEDPKLKVQFLEKLEENHGDLHKTYTEMGIKYNRFYEWRKTDPEFNDAIERIKLDTVRWVESKMFETIADGNTDLMKFYLKMHKDGQKLGYVETKKIEAEVKGQVDVEKQLEEMAEKLADDSQFSE